MTKSVIRHKEQERVGSILIISLPTHWLVILSFLLWNTPRFFLVCSLVSNCIWSIRGRPSLSRDSRVWLDTDIQPLHFWVHHNFRKWETWIFRPSRYHLMNNFSANSRRRCRFRVFFFTRLRMSEGIQETICFPTTPRVWQRLPSLHRYHYPRFHPWPNTYQPIRSHDFFSHPRDQKRVCEFARIH